jgi:hypothetical protein
MLHPHDASPRPSASDHRFRFLELGLGTDVVGLTLATTLPVRGSTSINISELYADEERRLLLFLHVLRARATGDQDTVMRLVEVSCSYRDTSIERTKNLASEDVVVRRPASIARQWSALQRWTASACVCEGDRRHRGGAGRGRARHARECGGAVCCGTGGGPHERCAVA